MDPPGKHPKKGSFAFLRKRSKEEKNAKQQEKNSKQQGSRRVADPDDESYVKTVASSVGGGSSAVSIKLPPEVVRQQEQLLAKAKQQQEHQKEAAPMPALDTSMSSVSNSLIQRKAVHRKAPSLSSYQITPITKHYEISRQILTAFDSHWSNNLWVTAYAVGMQFVETALLEIPKHGYFYAARHERERMENSLEAARVARLLQDLLLGQEKEEVTPDAKGLAEPTAGLVPSGDLQRVQKLLNLALEEVERASSDQDKRQHQHAREEVEEDIRHSQEEENSTMETDWIVCADQFVSSCTDGLSSVFETRGKDASATGGRNSIIEPDASTIASNRSLFREEIPISEESAVVLEEPSLLSMDFPGSSFVTARPPGPPAMAHHRSDELMLEKALFLSGMEVTEAGMEEREERVPPPPHHRRKQSSAMLELSTLSMLYHEDFDSLQQSKRVRISFAGTYQGRLPESTNGCTVIAPLLCIHHLALGLAAFHYETGGDPGLPDPVIESCIDVETPAVLMPLRKQLGLSDQAFLIPADTHDYLIENGSLSQDQFHSVIGGNILDDGHLRKFVSELGNVKGRKVAATLFFHEHVVAIIKLKRLRSDGKVSYWYDVMDSLPLKKTFCRSGESEIELCERLGIFSDLTEDEIAEEQEMTALPRTSRIRCLDSESLIAVIRWYACSKFNDENMAYIDQYRWDDTETDFDPRVFQSFIWTGVELDDYKRQSSF